MRTALAGRPALPCMLILPLLVCGWAHAGDDAAALDLARNGKTNYLIVQGKSATASEAFAVAELRDYLEKASGAPLPVVVESERPCGARAIYVGWTEFAIRHGLDPAKLGKEEWVIETVGQDLVLTGGRPVGSLYAVYEFLETLVGCRWLDRDTEIVPRHVDLAIPTLKVRSKPAFWHRTINTGPPSVIREEPPAPSSQWLVEEGLFLLRNKFRPDGPRSSEALGMVPPACAIRSTPTRRIFPRIIPNIFPWAGMESGSAPRAAPVPASFA